MLFLYANRWRLQKKNELRVYVIFSSLEIRYNYLGNSTEILFDIESRGVLTPHYIEWNDKQHFIHIFIRNVSTVRL